MGITLPSKKIGMTLLAYVMGSFVWRNVMGRVVSQVSPTPSKKCFDFIFM